MPWGAVAGAVIGAGASIYGSNKASKAIEKGGDAATAFQSRAFDTQLDIARPQLEVGNSALGVLAQLFGLDAPSRIDFDNLGGTNRNGYADDRNATPAEITQIYRDVLGRDPDPGGLQYYTQGGFTPAQVADAHRGSAEYRTLSEQGRLPESETNPQSQQQNQGVPGQGANLDELVANNPLIRFQREQGEQAIARGAAARGLNQSGGTLKDLTQFSSDLTGAGVQQFVLNPLFQLAGFGQQQGAQLSNAAGAQGTNLGNIALGQADARASAFQNQGNTLGNLAAGLPSQFNTRTNNPNQGATAFGQNPTGGTFFGQTAGITNTQRPSDLFSILGNR